MTRHWREFGPQRLSEATRLEADRWVTEVVANTVAENDGVTAYAKTGTTTETPADHLLNQLPRCGQPKKST